MDILFEEGDKLELGTGSSTSISQESIVLLGMVEEEDEEENLLRSSST